MTAAVSRVIRVSSGARASAVGGAGLLRGVGLCRRALRSVRGGEAWSHVAPACSGCLRGRGLTGGGSLLDGMDELIQERTGINTVTAENPASVVALGAGQDREVMNEFESQF